MAVTSPSVALYGTPVVSAYSGASFRQLTYWHRNGYLVASLPSSGSGSRRGYTAREARIAWALIQLQASQEHPGRPSTTVVRALRQLDPWGGYLICQDGHADVVPTILGALDVLADGHGAALLLNLDRCPPMGAG